MKDLSGSIMKAKRWVRRLMNVNNEEIASQSNGNRKKKKDEVCDYLGDKIDRKWWLLG